MSELAQRIVTSHKEAAKRAAEHLSRTRKLKLSSTESLELVARVLGVANWQTLLGLANAGKGPRIDDGAVFVAPEVAPKELTAAEQLANYYGTPTAWGAHPKWTRKDWAYEVDNNDTGASYWEYVVSEIESHQEMYPWERDASFAVQLVKKSGAEVGEGDDGWVLCTQHDFFFGTEHDDEKSVWDDAADELQRHMAVVLKLSTPSELSEAQWLKLAEEYFAALGSAPAAPAAAEPYDSGTSETFRYAAQLVEEELRPAIALFQSSPAPAEPYDGGTKELFAHMGRKAAKEMQATVDMFRKSEQSKLAKAIGEAAGTEIARRKVIAPEGTVVGDSEMWAVVHTWVAKATRISEQPTAADLWQKVAVTVLAHVAEATGLVFEVPFTAEQVQRVTDFFAKQHRS